MGLDRRPAPVPVLLVTGALGSGKTTLLRHWFTLPALEQAALIVMESGRTSFEAGRGRAQVDAPASAAGACLCCEGLPGLAQALEQLFWDRLHRRVPRFDRVVIETAGATDPGLIAQVLRGHPLVAERYCLEGTLRVHACGGASITSGQIAGADALLVTTTAAACDPAALAELRRSVRGSRPDLSVTELALQAPCDPAPLLQALAATKPRLAAPLHPDTAFEPRPWGRSGSLRA
jgi:G3E family GTPase